MKQGLTGPCFIIWIYSIVSIALMKALLRDTIFRQSMANCRCQLKPNREFKELIRCVYFLLSTQAIAGSIASNESRILNG